MNDERRAHNVERLAGMLAMIERARGANVADVRIVYANGRVIGWHLVGQSEMHGYSLRDA